MSISGTGQASRRKHTSSPFLAPKAVFYAAILITIRRTAHFQAEALVLNPFSLTSSFGVSGHFESDLSHSGGGGGKGQRGKSVQSASLPR